MLTILELNEEDTFRLGNDGSVFVNGSKISVDGNYIIRRKDWDNNIIYSELPQALPTTWAGSSPQPKEPDPTAPTDVNNHPMPDYYDKDKQRIETHEGEKKWTVSLVEKYHYPPNAVQQDWTLRRPLMQQSVLFAAIRAPDGMRKDHIVKVIMRWYRRCVLKSAFHGFALNDPFSEGGGSFTGPFTVEHAYEIRNDFNVWNDCNPAGWYSEQPTEFMWDIFAKVRETYLRHVDEMPHHFQMHLMHAAEIVGYYHPDIRIAHWWEHFYKMIVNDMHLPPESRSDMDRRLSDNENAWRAREQVPAK